jgi:hypothetical protein
MVARAAIGAVFLALQIGVPTVLLFARRPARFGWQMFAAHTVSPAFAVEHADGSRALVRVDDYFAFRRADLDPATYDRLPAHLCRLDPTVVVVYERRVPDAAAPIESHPCR